MARRKKELSLIKPEAKNVDLDAQDGLMVPQSQKPKPEKAYVYIKDRSGRIQAREVSEKRLAKGYVRVRGYQAPVYEKAATVTEKGKTRRIAARKIEGREMIYDKKTRSLRDPNEFESVRVKENGEIVRKRIAYKQRVYRYKEVEPGVYEEQAKTVEVKVKREARFRDLITLQVSQVYMANSDVMLDMVEILGEPIVSNRRYVMGKNPETTRNHAWYGFERYVKSKVMELYETNDPRLRAYLNKRGLPWAPPATSMEVEPQDPKFSTFEVVGEQEQKALPEMAQGIEAEPELEQYVNQGM